MMKISTKGQYALLIMTDLAEMDNGKFISLKTLSLKHNLSIKYLEQILSQLSKSGLVTGLRGNNGGYKLTKKSQRIHNRRNFTCFGRRPRSPFGRKYKSKRRFLRKQHFLGSL